MTPDEIGRFAYQLIQLERGIYEGPFEELKPGCQAEWIAIGKRALSPEGLAELRKFAPLGTDPRAGEPDVDAVKGVKSSIPRKPARL